MIENKLRGAQGSDATKVRVRVIKAKEVVKPVIVDRSVSMGNVLVKEAIIRIVLIMVNLNTLLVIALSERLSSNQPCSKGPNIFREISKGSRCIYMGNNASAIMLGIGTCKLELWGGRTLYLHDVLYAPKV